LVVICVRYNTFEGVIGKSTLEASIRKKVSPLKDCATAGTRAACCMDALIIQARTPRNE
jgi:hypothetical protein